MDELFLALTPDRVLDAVDRFGPWPTGRCTPLVCRENRVYDLPFEGPGLTNEDFFWDL